MRGAVIFLVLSAVASRPVQIERVFISSQPGYRLVVEASGSNDEENGRRLAIYSPGQRTVVSPEGGLATVRDSMAPAFSAKNRLNSKFLFATAPMPDDMIIVFGPAFASDPGAVRILRLSA